MSSYINRFACITMMVCVGFAPIAGYAAPGVPKAPPLEKTTLKKPVKPSTQVKPKPQVQASPKAEMMRKRIAHHHKFKHHAKSDSSSSSSSSSSDQERCEYDYVIVGLGTAGAPLARYLSDDFQNSVLVLEAGYNLSTDPKVTMSTFNPAFATAFSVLTADSKYADTWYVSDEKNFPTITAYEQYSAGRMWGGSSAHNAQQAVRGTPDVYDKWDAAVGGSSVWTYNNLLPFMKGMENYAVSAGNSPIDTSQRGISGQLYEFQTTQTVPASTISYYANIAAQTGGANHIADGADYNAVTGGHVLPNDGQNIGMYLTQFYTTHEPAALDRQRSFSIPAWISSVVTADGHGLDGRDLTILSGATADRVIFDENLKATGIHYIHSGESKIAKAKKQIILCAGCPGSSTILKRSGIG